MTQIHYVRIKKKKKKKDTEKNVSSAPGPETKGYKSLPYYLSFTHI